MSKQDQIELSQTPRGKGAKGYAKLFSTNINSPGRSQESLLSDEGASQPPPPRIQLQKIQLESDAKREPKCKRSCDMYFTVACKNVKRKKCEFVLCFFSCLVVVVITLLAKTVVANGSLIFLSMAQYNSGQKDIIIYQSGNRTEEGVNYMNGTHIQELIDRRLPGYKGSVHLEIHQSLICEGSCDTTKKSHQVGVLGLNADLEKEIGIGTSFQFQESLGQGECLISQAVADNLQLEAGNEAYIQITLGRYFETLKAQYQFQRGKHIKLNDTVSFECRIMGVYKTQGGRTSQIFIDIVYVELAHYFNNFAHSIRVEEGDRDDFLNFIRSLNPKDYASDISFNLPGNRINYYLNTDFAQLQSQVSKIASEMVGAINPNMVAAWLPVLWELNFLATSNVFFSIIINLVILLLAVLSIMLIATLLLQSVETKTTEIGTLRMLGVNKCDLFWILLSQTFLFSIPALVIGFLLSFPLLVIVSNFFYDSVGYSIAPVPSLASIIMTLFLGFFIPAFASLFPLGATIETTISDALNYARSRTRGTLINILSQSKSGAVRSALLGSVGVVFGGCIYYLLPLGIASRDYPLLTNIFFLLLVGMLVGFSLLALNFQYIIEIIIVKVLFCWEKAVVLTLIFKNLAAHRLQNQKTSILYTLSIGFTIMIVASYQMQLRQSELLQLKSNGAYLTFYSSKGQFPLCTDCILGVIQANPHIVADYTFNSFPPQKIDMNPIRQVIFGDRSGIANFKVNLIGIPSNFFQPLIQDFLKIESRSSSKLTLEEQLYTAKGSQGFGSRVILQDSTSISIHNNSDTALISLVYPHKRSFLELHPMWSVDQAPTFDQSDRNLGTEYVVVSLPQFRRIVGYSSITEIPITSAYLKLHSQVTNQEISSFISDVKQSYPVDQVKRDIQVFNYRDTEESVQGVQSLLDTIFSLVLVIVMLLCFFSLSGAMASNIYHQNKEIAILRAVGLTRKRITLLYIYEAFVIVFSSGLQGLIIGVVLGELLIIQQVLFVNIPLTFYFPVYELLAMFVTSVFTAIMASCLPARSLLSLQIAQIIRSNA